MWGGAMTGCPVCHAPLQAMVFPAVLEDRRSAGEQGLTTKLDDAEAGCFYHPAKRAVQACDGCGRFLCGLCDLELEGKHLCPGCLEGGRTTGKIAKLQNRRVLHDNMALAVAVLPLLMWPFTIISAPAALYMVVRHWKTPGSIIPRTKVRFVIAAIFAIAQIVGWCLLAYFLISNLGTSES